MKPTLRLPQHGVGGAFGHLDGVHHGLGAGYHVAGTEHARHARLAVVVDHEQAAVVTHQPFGREKQLVHGLLRRRDDHRVAGHLVEPLLVADDLVVLVEDCRSEEGACLVYLGNRLAIDDVGPVEPGVFNLVRAGGDVLGARVHRHVPRTVAKCRARDVHGGVAHADDRDVLADLVGLGAHEVIEAEVHVAARLPGDAERLGAPGPRADEHGVVAVAEQVVDEQRVADGGVGPDLDAEPLERQPVARDGRAWQAEVWDAVAEHAADLGALFEDGDVDACLGEPEGCHDACRAASDDRGFLTGRRGRFGPHAVEVCVGHVGFDGRELHRCALASEHAAALALHAVVAHQRTDERERVVPEQQRAGLLDAALFEQGDGLGNGGVDRACLLAARPFAAEAALSVFDDVQGHACLPRPSGGIQSRTAPSLAEPRGDGAENHAVACLLSKDHVPR